MENRGEQKLPFRNVLEVTGACNKLVYLKVGIILNIFRNSRKCGQQNLSKYIISTHSVKSTGLQL
jgi:hypothetical protein